MLHTLRPSKRESVLPRRKQNMKRLITIAVLLTMALTAQADDRRQRESRDRPEPNYIIRRQEAYQVQGVPTSRLIIGKRQIDIYPNGEMFEGDHMIGVRK